MWIKVWSFTLLNLKIQISEKIAVVWSLLFPVVFAFMYKNSNGQLDDEGKMYYMAFFWSFIIVVTFIQNVGLYLARLREMGQLKTYVLIAGTKTPFILSALLTQIIFCYLSMSIFNLVLGVYMDILSVKLFLYSALMMLCSLPFGAATLILTTLPAKVSSTAAIINIAFIPLSWLANHSGSLPELLKILNPFYFVIQFYLLLAYGDFGFEAGGMLALYALAALYSIRTMSLSSPVQR
ncbi:hypothetical protein Q5741_14590 [Paenibacillus sp. JX-17]|uniref:ABC transporter permease n=1 Tax=Paenibacillus lacisoli TaxID=3064525 RepID=A0ABT9CEE4_9BACL|nr:hypothetical protein [Paenibacillus sp. JX-17]MDO7907635.1 hypothetical protein [Paenibacillus sp. JX-17]